MAVEKSRWWCDKVQVSWKPKLRFLLSFLFLCFLLLLQNSQTPNICVFLFCTHWYIHLLFGAHVSVCSSCAAFQPDHVAFHWSVHPFVHLSIHVSTHVSIHFFSTYFCGDATPARSLLLPSWKYPLPPTHSLAPGLQAELCAPVSDSGVPCFLL